jgi:hypothetical protein
MKKLVAITMMVLATAGVAMAVPSFTLPSEILINAGETIVVSIGTAGDMLAGNGQAGAQGVVMYVGTTSPFELSGGDFLAPGLLFASNHVGESISGDLLPSILMGNVGTLSGNVLLGAPVMTLSLTCPVGTPLGTVGKLSTDLGQTDPENFGGTVSDFGGVEGGQATAVIRVIPEPATALLLLAAVPFLRRRHA